LENPEGVLVTGLGVACGLGIGVSTFWNSLLRGESSLRTTNNFDEAPSGSQWLARIPEFSIRDRFPQLRTPLPSRYSQLALLAALAALEDAGFIERQNEDVGTILTTEFGPNATVEKYLLNLMTIGPKAASPLAFAGSVANIALGDIARLCALRGVSSLVLGEDSVAYGFELLQDRRASAILCGGVDEIRGVHLWSFDRAKVLASVGNYVPTPYSKINGMALGEGAAFLLLESEAHARSRGTAGYARVVGHGAIRDRGQLHLLGRRTAEDIVVAMRRALKDASLRPEDVQVLVGGANSHPFTSFAELSAVQAVWGSTIPCVTNIKGAVGETFGASAALNHLAAVLALHEARIPPVSKNGTTDTYPTAVITKESEFVGRYCMSNSIHVGGTDSTLIFAIPSAST
jgi:3-oxoacyl-[acyl-carrier-protein] synthase II